jgi:hypothetical protein
MRYEPRAAEYPRLRASEKNLAYDFAVAGDGRKNVAEKKRRDVCGFVRRIR